MADKEVLVFTTVLPPILSDEGREDAECALFAQVMDAVSFRLCDFSAYRLQVHPVEIQPLEFGGISCQRMIMTLTIEEIKQ